MEGHSKHLLNIEERGTVSSRRDSPSSNELSRALNHQDKLLETIEEALVMGFKKLCIDDAEARSSIEKLITDRKSIGNDLSAFDALASKQDFALEQIKQLQLILDKTNNLAEVVDKLKAFERDQLELQKSVQNNYDVMKAIFKKPDIRSGERKRTYLCVNYAEPMSPRESLSIVYDIIDTITRNQVEMHQAMAAKLDMLSQCDLGDVAMNSIQMIQAHMPSLLDSVKSSIEDTPESSELSSIQDRLEFDLPTEKQAGQTVSYFVRHMNGWLPVLFKALKIIQSGLGMNSRMEEDMINLEDQLAECRLEMRDKDQEIARLKELIREQSGLPDDEEEKQENEQVKEHESDSHQDYEEEEAGELEQIKDKEDLAEPCNSE
jgi:hypothetical protein